MADRRQPQSREAKIWQGFQKDCGRDLGKWVDCSKRLVYEDECL
jgi:hypothetical protein